MQYDIVFEIDAIAVVIPARNGWIANRGTAWLWLAKTANHLFFSHASGRGVEGLHNTALAIDVKYVRTQAEWGAAADYKK